MSLGRQGQRVGMRGRLVRPELQPRRVSLPRPSGSLGRYSANPDLPPHAPTLLLGVVQGSCFLLFLGPPCSAGVCAPEPGSSVTWPLPQACRPPRAGRRLCQTQTHCSLRKVPLSLVAHCWTWLFLSNPEFCGAGNSACEVRERGADLCVPDSLLLLLLLRVPFSVTVLQPRPRVHVSPACRTPDLAGAPWPPAAVMAVHCPAQVRRLSVFLPMLEAPDHVLLLKRAFFLQST